MFDSRQPAGTGQAVYMVAIAEELSGTDVERGLEVYPGPADRGARRFEVDDVRPPAAYRLYRASVSQHSTLCPRSSGPCAEHGRAFDHRTAVVL
ncbi:MAG: hypothetical protein GEU88_06240 [Solirubrobacterales bacterium]|nr:hypothetical protein [Solirubrobacterales bacterium]